MISLANEKKNKLDLKKVNFYVSDHNFPKSSEKESCNFLYINSPKNVRWRNEAFSYRIAKKGVFLLGKVAFNDSEYSFFNNFTFQKRQEIISFDGLKYENCIFNKKEV